MAGVLLLPGVFSVTADGRQDGIQLFKASLAGDNNQVSLAFSAHARCYSVNAMLGSGLDWPLLLPFVAKLKSDYKHAASPARRLSGVWCACHPLSPVLRVCSGLRCRTTTASRRKTATVRMK
jgi:hypothetical protein